MGLEFWIVAFFCMGNPKKIRPMTIVIWRAHRFQLGRILLTIHFYSDILHDSDMIFKAVFKRSYNGR